VPEINKLGGKPARIEGHTDAIGTDSYNLETLGGTRRRCARLARRKQRRPHGNADQRLRQNHADAPNVTNYGKDEPTGRQKNRRVEVVFEACM
jgi:outer membrane protein OmpA-like peptidoglycan-associated protein